MPAWHDILNQIEGYRLKANREAAKALERVRSEYLKRLHDLSGRNIITYYSGFLSKQIRNTEITDEDMSGFMNAVHGLDRRNGLDLILHTPGGSVAATFSIVHYLSKMFKDDIRAFVPHIAMSGGTIMACSTREIIMAKHSQLGPIDPQFGGMPAAGVLLEFDTAKKEIKKDPSCTPVWQAIIGQYMPSFLGQCHNALLWSQQFTEERLRNVMFKGKRDAAKRAKRVVKKLTDYKANKRHERPIHMDECETCGLEVDALETQPGDTQDVVLSLHHCYMHAFMNGPAFKIIENHQGGTMVKNMAMPPQQS